MELTRHSSRDRSKIPLVENYLNSYRIQFEYNFIYYLFKVIEYIRV